MGNREALLEAAIVCLRERGYGGTTARDVAGSAEVSLGAIRYHFGSMDGLLGEAVAECGRRWIRGFQRSLAARAATDPRSNLLAEVEHLYEIFESERALVVGVVEAFAHAQRSPQAREQLARLYDELRTGIAAGIDAGIGADRACGDTIASIFIAFADGLMVQWLLEPERRLDPDALRHVINALIAGITTHSPT
ncbi:TetR/AcrR family transcriptional regulator [Pseudonocardia acaciae]|uniref:TetR/AcrR family transcriptional regulator n=1 Tax=Pseudonocardia acaciae TaxID=551276 RepID=UPI000686D13B|nr:TetR/AcrR family transcriptional regulator [Pseudonocardia acaciae]